LKITTTRFGTIEIQEEQIIQVPAGIIGFPEYKRYVLLEHKKGSSFFWFQAVDNEGLAFVLINPGLFSPDYRFALCPEDQEALEIRNGRSEIQTLAIVSITQRATDEKPVEMTANLLGPIVINVQKRLARQIVLEGSPYSHRQPIPLGKK
jgi:flagellar assembly factor FliW